jgi:predicted CoA-binding protein
MFFSDILKSAKTIAVVGLSDKPDRPSVEVASYLQSKGYRIIPINPNVPEVLGEKAYPDIHSIPTEIQVDVVDIFRKSEEVLPHVKEAISRGGVKLIWLQEGVYNQEAEKLAIEAKIPIIMNACMMKSHKLGY